MEYVLGPVLALLVSMKFTQWKTKPPKYTHEEMIGRIEVLEKAVTERESEMAQKVMSTVTPIAQAVLKLKQEIGVQ